jgi:hypothetical protein
VVCACGRVSARHSGNADSGDNCEDPAGAVHAVRMWELLREDGYTGSYDAVPGREESRRDGNRRRWEPPAVVA